ESPGPVTPHVRNKTQMVVIDALLDADRVPSTDGAVLDRMGVRLRLIGEPGEESSLGAPVVGVEVAYAKARSLIRAEDDMHLLGQDTLNTSNLLAVEGELQKEVGLCRARELRVRDLVAERPQCRWPLDPLEEICGTQPAVRDKSGLI